MEFVRQPDRKSHAISLCMALNDRLALVYYYCLKH